MIYPVPFHAEHLHGLKLQKAQEWSASKMSVQIQKTLEGPLSTTLMQDGYPLVCVGIIEFAEHRCLLWTFFSDKVTAKNFREMHRWAKTFLRLLPYNRIEATTEVDFEQGNRWLKSLGFEREDKNGMREFGEDGKAHALYALIRTD